MRVAIIDYGSGNLHSAAQAVVVVGARLSGACDVAVTDDPAVVAKADRVVLPGVGAFGDCMAGVRGLPGMVEALNDAVIEKGRPFLGICVGMQLMAARGLEHGTYKGLSWIDGDVVTLKTDDRQGLKIPHMGWNDLQLGDASHPLFAGWSAVPQVYFVHSYFFDCRDPGQVLATTDYGGAFPAIVGRDNMVGTQFHPEKSQSTGLKFLENFLTWRP